MRVAGRGRCGGSSAPPLLCARGAATAAAACSACAPPPLARRRPHLDLGRLRDAVVGETGGEALAQAQLSKARGVCRRLRRGGRGHEHAAQRRRAARGAARRCHLGCQWSQEAAQARRAAGERQARAPQGGRHRQSRRQHGCFMAMSEEQGGRYYSLSSRGQLIRPQGGEEFDFSLAVSLRAPKATVRPLLRPIALVGAPSYRLVPLPGPLPPPLAAGA